MVRLKLVSEPPPGLPAAAFARVGNGLPLHDPCVVRLAGRAGSFGQRGTSALMGGSVWAVVSGGSPALRQRVVDHLRDVTRRDEGRLASPEARRLPGAA